MNLEEFNEKLKKLIEESGEGFTFGFIISCIQGLPGRDAKGNKAEQILLFNIRHSELYYSLRNIMDNNDQMAKVILDVALGYMAEKNIEPVLPNNNGEGEIGLPIMMMPGKKDKYVN